MRDLGTLWERCNNGNVQKGEWDYERMLTIDGVVYHDKDIIKVTHDKGLVANSFSIGNTISGSIKATVIPHTDHTVRRNGKILLKLRIVTLNDGATDWFEFGHYYINSAKREKDKWTIEGYDAINQLETPFVTSNTNWPQSCTNAINQILSFLNIELDPRTSINSSLQIQDPTELTMREVLGYIGGLHGGNWCITETNKLRLIIPSLGTKVATVLPGNTKKLLDSGVMNFDKIILKFSSSVKDKYTSGSGKNELEVYNPWGTQSTADNIMNILSDYDYYPGEYKSTEINPAIELGDTIEIGDKLVNLWQVSYSTRIYADIYIPDQTDKYRDTYDFVFGGDTGGGIGGDYEDRIDLLEDMLGVKGCIIPPNEDFDTNTGHPMQRYLGNEKCVILPNWTHGRPLGDLNGKFYQTSVEKVFTTSNIEAWSLTGMFEESMANSIDISGVKAYGVNSVVSMFSNSNAMNLIWSQQIDTSNLKYMSYMFASSRVNNMVNANNINTDNVINVSGMFEYFNGYNFNLDFLKLKGDVDVKRMFFETDLWRFNFENFDTSKLTNMEGMFEGMVIEGNVNSLGSINTSNVTNMSNTFAVHLMNIHETLDFTFLDTSNVTDMRGMFNVIVQEDTTRGEYPLIHLDIRGLNFSKVSDENLSSFLPLYKRDRWKPRLVVKFNNQDDLNRVKLIYDAEYIDRYGISPEQDMSDSGETNNAGVEFLLAD